MTRFTPDQLERYSRHTLMPAIGPEGQQRLLAGRVLLIGAGGLGSPVATYLAAAGVGTLGIVDDDRVELSNLQRQILHATPSVGQPKTESARRRIADLNPDVRVVAHPVRLTSANALEILADYDVVVDGTDNFATRYLSNDACALLGKPNVYGSVYQFEGQVSVFWRGHGPCYRCLFPEPPPPGEVPSCAEAGVLGILPGVIGLLQATEALKLLLDLGDSLAGRLLLYDALAMDFRTIRVRRSPDCPLCGDNPTIRALVDYHQFCGRSGPVSDPADLPVTELHARLGRGDDLVVIDVRDPYEFAAGHVPGSRLVPLGELPARLAELADFREREIAVVCKVGIRSARAVEVLRGAGFANPRNVPGGFSEWVRRGFDG